MTDTNFTECIKEQNTVEKKTGKAGWVSDEAAKSILGDWSMKDYLSRKGGLNITKDMSLTERIAAVRKAITNMIRKQSSKDD